VILRPREIPAINHQKSGLKMYSGKDLFDPLKIKSLSPNPDVLLSLLKSQNPRQPCSEASEGH
jgi:hypothetical protein